MLEFPSDFVTPVEVAINAPDKDGDIFDEQKDLVAQNDDCKREKLSLNELGECSACRSSSTCQSPSDNEKNYDINTKKGAF